MPYIAGLGRPGSTSPRADALGQNPANTSALCPDCDMRAWPDPGTAGVAEELDAEDDEEWNDEEEWEVEVSDILPGMETRKASAAPHGTGVRDDTPGATKLMSDVA
jgi:hypothetical protein